MTGFEIAYAIVAIGLLVAAMFLMPKPKNPGIDTNFVTTLATRGTYLNFVIGKHRVGPVFAWAGDRRSRNAGGGGKSFVGGGGSSGKEWYESGWHLLATGPVTKLWAIMEGGKEIWTGPIDSNGTPSGSTVTVAGHGSFMIWWGEIDQPICEFLGVPSRIGIRSRWPNACYIIWIQKKLGGSPVWSQLEYIITSQCPKITLADSDYRLDDKGVNPAHALHQILTAPFPQGVNLPLDSVDATTLEALGELMETENIPMNMRVGASTSSTPAGNLVAMILQDAGVFMPQVDGRLAFMPVREPIGDVPDFTDDVVSPPDLERIIDRGDNGISRVVFSFIDEEANGYSQQDIPFDDDGEFDNTRGIKSQTVTINTITNFDIANVVARRRAQEVEADTTITVSALRGARQLCAGQVFHREGFGNLRVLGVKLDDESSGVILTCSPDIYSIPDTDDFLALPTPGSSSSLTPEEDLAVRWIELPATITTDVAISVFRVRANEQVSSADIYVSADDVTYTLAGSQDAPAAGGSLLGSISATTADILVAGPIFEADNADAETILDLSDDDPSWMAGRQLVLVDNEILYLQSVTLQTEADWQASHAYSIGDAVLPSDSTGVRYVCSTAGTSDTDEPTFPEDAGDTVTDGTVVWTAHHYRYQMNNLIRARQGTVAALHNIGAQVFIADQTAQQVLTASLIQPGVDLYVKSVPANNSNVVDISTITAVTGTLTGAATGDSYRTGVDGKYRVTVTGERRVIIV